MLGRALLKLHTPHPQYRPGSTFYHNLCVISSCCFFLLHLAHLCLSPLHIRGLKAISLAAASRVEDPDFKEKLCQIFLLGMCRGGFKDK